MPNINHIKHLPANLHLLKKLFRLVDKNSLNDFANSVVEDKEGYNSVFINVDFGKKEVVYYSFSEKDVLENRDGEKEMTLLVTPDNYDGAFKYVKQE